MVKPAARPRTEIGWREMVALPGLGIPELKAKIDTGARTSALHAIDIRPETRDGVAWVSFRVPYARGGGRMRTAAPVLDEREIRNTSGVPERRYVIETVLILGTHRWQIEVSLANRAKMEFELILGRTAIRRHRMLVDAGRSYLVGAPVGPKPKRPVRPGKEG